MMKQMKISVLSRKSSFTHHISSQSVGTILQQHHYSVHEPISQSKHHCGPTKLHSCVKMCSCIVCVLRSGSEGIISKSEEIRT
jgi:hypothetical protein